jgi:hypothetical protein
MTKEQKAFLETRYKQFYVKGWDELLIKLKAHGGEMIVPMPENELRVLQLLKYGRVFEGVKIKVKKGKPNKCHENASRLWAESEHLQLVRGYALHDDGLWRQHSWTFDPKTGEIIETTEPATKYFGVVFSDVQAFQYVIENVPGDDIPKKVSRRMDKCADNIIERYSEAAKFLHPQMGETKIARKKAKKK